MQAQEFTGRWIDAGKETEGPDLAESTHLVCAITEDGTVFHIEDIFVEDESSTVWLKVSER